MNTKTWENREETVGNTNEARQNQTGMNETDTRTSIRGRLRSGKLWISPEKVCTHGRNGTSERNANRRKMSTGRRHKEMLRPNIARKSIRSDRKSSMKEKTNKSMTGSGNNRQRKKGETREGNTTRGNNITTTGEHSLGRTAEKDAGKGMKTQSNPLRRRLCNINADRKANKRSKRRNKKLLKRKGTRIK
jgi:hypothetical protein